MKYKHTLPETLQEKAVIARSRQATDFKWTPICDVPTFYRDKGNTVLPAGEEITGFPYSSLESTDKFITENVSIETFLSTIHNPYSKLYQAGRGAFNSCNYGMVCNGLARYAFGIERRVSTLCFHTIPGMRRIARKNEYSVNDIKLCDVLLAINENRPNHVALITDVLKNENGETVGIEVSEAVRPHCKRECYLNEEFYQKYDVFELWRYDNLDKVPLLDEKVDSLLRNNPYTSPMAVSVDNGHKSNYLEGDEVIITATVPDNDILEIICNDKTIEEIPMINKILISRRFNRGYYVLKLKKSGEQTEFCVNKAKIEYKAEKGEITVYADPCDKQSEILYMDFRQPGNGYASLAKYEELTQEEKQTGIIKRKIPDNGENFRVYFKNKYGVWVHKMTYIK